MHINDLSAKAYLNANSKGFWEDWEDTGYGRNNCISTRLMLIVGEVAEAQEALRKNDALNFREELADVAIRLADLCGGLGIDLEHEIEVKMIKNAQRPYKHGKLF